MAYVLLENQPNKESIVYQSLKSKALHRLATAYYLTQRYSESEMIFKEAIDIRRHLASINPELYEIELSWTLNNLANLFSND